MPSDPRPTLADPDDDPRLWLEEIEGAAALDWVARQNSATLDALGGPQFETNRDIIADILDRPDRIPFITRRGGLIYNFWKDADNPRGLWRRTTLESFRQPHPDWEIVLDVDALAQREGADWIWSGAATSPGQSRAILKLSRGGGDAVTLREFDLETKELVSNGFEAPEAKSGIAWLDGDTLLLSSALGDGMSTTAGYARTVRRWRRGEEPLRASVIFETAEESILVAAGRDLTQPSESLWFLEMPSFFEQIHYVGDRNGPVTRLNLPTDIRLDGHRDWIVVSRRGKWELDGQTYAAGALLGCARAELLAGAPRFTPLFEPGERRVLDEFNWVGDRLLISVLDELKPSFELWTPSADGWRSAELTGIPDTGVADVMRLDSEPVESDGAMLVFAQDPATPPSMLLISPTSQTQRVNAEPSLLAAPELLRQAPAVFDATELETTRHEAVAADGVRIPYTMTAPKTLDAPGDAPVYVTGYGGFEIPVLPRYNGSIGKLWLEQGGVSVIAHIRGGGEFGSPWHEAGRRAGKRQSHDDFAAIAADLVTRGITRPSRIAAEGGSNGGLLIANMLTRHPEKFGALFCTVPLIDMRRYTQLLAGASWIAEYGDPSASQDWAFLGPLSAYHMAEPSKRYPPILVATTKRDDRVHPGHARKFAAKLQDLGYDATYFEPAAGGHGYGKDNKERAAFTALGLRFLKSKIGWA